MVSDYPPIDYIYKKKAIGLKSEAHADVCV